MRIFQRVYLIASGRAECSLSHPADCNAYGVDCGGPVLLVDSGVGVSTRDLIDRFTADGVDPGKLLALLLTQVSPTRIRTDCALPALPREGTPASKLALMRRW